MVLEPCLGKKPSTYECRLPQSFKWLVRWCLFLGICNIAICGYIEIVEQQGCHESEFRLTCPSLDSHLAILESVFTPLNSTTFVETMAESNDSSSCGASPFLFSYPHTSAEKYNVSRRVMAEDRTFEKNLRAPISYRCSGVNHCSFILNLDHEESETWGPGIVYIKYACMDESFVTKFCNAELQSDEGFVQTPGYPLYYVGDGTCRWIIRSPKGQTVRLTVLDLSLRSIGPFENECVDHLTIFDSLSQQVLLTSCDQVERPLIFESVGETLDVFVRTRSKKVFPKRGVLFHYKAVGCVTPAAPRDGYLVYRDGGRAHYMCCVGHAFPDTRKRERTVHCLRDNSWSEILPHCTKITSKIWEGNGTFVVDNTPQHSNDNSISNKMIVDIIIPSVIIAALFIGNAVIVLIIFKYRKRKDLELVDNDEFNMLARDVVKNGQTTHECNENLADAV